MKLTVEDLWVRELDVFEDSYRKDLKKRGHSAAGYDCKETGVAKPPKSNGQLDAIANQLAKSNPEKK